MQLTPRYGGPPALRIDVPMDHPAEPFLRQRRRLGAILAGLDADQWAVPSRCEGWTVQDVATHLVSTNQFWALSIASGVTGSPTRFLANFDPVKSPAQMVAASRGVAPSEVLDQYTEGVEALAGVIEGLDEAAWSQLAEAPPGHIAVTGVVLHGLWDAWIHERDILLPLEMEPERHDDEVAGCLHYAAAIGPALRATGGSTRSGSLAVQSTDPDLSFVVDAGPTAVVHEGPAVAGTPCLSGAAVALVEGLSYRAPLDHHLPEGDRWLLGGLDEVFDRTAAASG